MSARSALASRFETETRDLKSWIVESHPPDSVETFLRDMADGEAELVREDASLWRIQDADRELEFYVDTLSSRFWRFHSWSTASRSQSWLKSRIERSAKLDWAWLPAGHLRSAGPDGRHTKFRTDFGGRLRPEEGEHKLMAEGAWAEAILDYVNQRSDFARLSTIERVEYSLREDLGGIPSFLTERIDRTGRFLASGTDFKTHERQIAMVLRRYRRLIELIEGRRLEVAPLSEGGYRMWGSPITLRLSAPVPDMHFFLEELFSCREPFRLFGNPRQAGDYWTAEVADLHVGQRMSMDIGDTWLRVYIREGVCGNTVVRLASNLEHHLDARIRFSDPQIQAAFAAPQDSEASAA